MPAQTSPKTHSSASLSMVKRGVKCIKKPVNAQPLKHVKHVPLTQKVSTPVLSGAEDDPTTVQDCDSIMTDETEVIEVDSDIEEQDVLEQELGTFMFLFFLVVSHLFHF